MAKVSVIVPAAGAGKRFGSSGAILGKKVFQRIGDRPVFMCALELFASRRDVVQTMLVVAEEDVAELDRQFGRRLGLMGVDVVVGGPTRSQSVRNALVEVIDAADLICVHDAVRPCVSAQRIDAVFKQAEKTGAAILAWPVRGTLKMASHAGVIERTVPREGLWEAQTPQVFRRDLLRQAYAAGGDATDDAHLVERLGHPVSLVMGEAWNIKITTPADLALAAAVIKALPGTGTGPDNQGR